MHMGMILNKTWGVFGAAFLLLIGTMAGLGIWAYRDAKYRGLDARLWAAIVAFVPNLIGLWLYLFVGRKQQITICPSCGIATAYEKPYCSNCGAYISQKPAAVFSAKNNQLPLIFSFLCIISLCVLMFSTALRDIFFVQPEMLGTHNVIIGQGQTVRPGVWKLSFQYFDGEKVRVIASNPGTVTVKNTEIEQGTAEMAISIDGREICRIALNPTITPYVWDLSHYPAESRIIIHLYAQKAKGFVNMEWQEE